MIWTSRHASPGRDICIYIINEGMPNRPSIFAYLVFGLGGTSTEGITRPITLITWRGLGAKLTVQGEDSKEEA
jgi:hypothetical protein